MKRILFIISLLSFPLILDAQEFTTYTWENGKTKAEGPLVQGGIEDGEWKYYNQASILIQKVNYNFGTIDGDYEHYFENGKLSEKGSFKNARRDGTFQTYFENGKCSLIGYYTNGYKDSLWTSHFSNLF